MTTIRPAAAALAVTLSSAVIYSVCALAFMLWPDATLGFFNAWFHGLDLSVLRPVTDKDFTFGAFLYGLAGVAVTSFVMGLLVALFYNLLGRR